MLKINIDQLFKVNTKSAEHHSALTTSKNKSNHISYVDIKGTTYFSPIPNIAETLNDVNSYLPNSFNNKCGIDNTTRNIKTCNEPNNKIYDTECRDTWVS